MPITKRNGKYYWGSKGPFDSRKKAEQVEQAAHSSGYEQYVEHLDEQKMVGSPVGAADEGQRAPTASEIARHQKLTKEDGGVEGGGGTVFTSSDAGIFTPTYGGGGVRHQQRKNKKRTGVEKVASFMDDRSPHVFSKEVSKLADFLNKSGFPSDNFEAQNRMNNPKRLDWKKKNAGDTQHSVAHNHLPEGQFYKINIQKDEPPQYVERGQDKSIDREKWSEYTLAHQDDMERKIRGYDKESKRRHNDPDEPPAGQMGASSGQIEYGGISKQEGYGSAGQDDELHRGGKGDKIARRRSVKTPEEVAEYVNSSNYMKKTMEFINILKSMGEEDDDLSEM